MQIHTNTYLHDGCFCVMVDTVQFSPSESEKLAMFGEPVVNIGGRFSGTFNGVTVDFTLPAKPRQLSQGFPIHQCFSLADFNDAETRAVVYRLHIEARVRTALSQLMAKEVTAVGETLYNTGLGDAVIAGPVSQTGVVALDDGIQAVSFTLPQLFPVPPNSFVFTITNVDTPHPDITGTFVSYDQATGEVAVVLSEATDKLGYILNYTITHV